MIVSGSRGIFCQSLDAETYSFVSFQIKKVDTEADVFGSFCIQKLTNNFSLWSGPKTDIQDQFLDPETDIMSEWNFMGFKYHLMNYETYVSPWNLHPLEILAVSLTNKSEKKDWSPKNSLFC